jgi:crotonobetainyl-CoA:carnitine CoA-transferase CaiB-like acyl-CoA transferase
VIDDDTPTGPLAGLLVADFSRVLAGPIATMMLGDLGATVIKVEGPPTGDDTRIWKPPQSADGTSTYYLSVNRNKRSILLDLRDGEDLALAQRLAGRADVVVENFRTGGLTKYGLDYPAVSAANPSVVYCSITGFGSAGGAALGGYDLLVQAVSGLMSVTGERDGGPVKAGMPVMDVMTGLHAAIGILAALRHRDATGEGQHLETNLLSVGLAGLVNQSSAYLAGGVVPGRLGNEHLSVFPYEPYPTGDGELIVIAANNGQFRALVTVLGIPEVADDPRNATMEMRLSRRAEIRAQLVEALAARPAQEWFDLLSGVGVPCGPINTIDQGLELGERLGLDPVVRPGGVPSVRNPVTYSATPPTYRTAPPALGADGAAIRNWLEEN